MSPKIAKNTNSAQEMSENLPDEVPEIEYGTPLFAMPPWLQDNIPHEFSPCRMISHDPETGKFTVENDDAQYDSLEEAYNTHSRNDDYEVDIDDAAKVAAGLDPEFPIVILENGRYLSTFMDEDRLKLLQSGYDNAVAKVLEWLKDPGNYEKSYYMLNTHPAFWTRYGDTPSWNWNEGEHLLRFSHTLTEDGMSMTTEVADQQTRSKCVPDERLSVTGDTFEECIVLMAALVNQYYTIEGYAR